MRSFIHEGRSLHSEKYRPDIDGIRAIAVLAVVISHAFPDVLPGGFVGVDIFFVISGYLISQILMKNLDQGNFSLLTFYQRRIRRIFPALLVVLAFTMLFGWFCLFRPEFGSLGRHTVASALFSENFLLWSEAGYFDTESRLKPTLHLWSLAIEEQFYIVWPLLLYAVWRSRISFPAVIAVLAMTSLAINLRDIHVNPTAAYYSPLGRSWELMIGSGLAYLDRQGLSLSARQRDLSSSAGVLLIILALVLVRPESGFPGLWALLPTVGTALLLAAGDQAWFNRRVLSLSPMIWCGLISYPLYLWHWPFLSFGSIIFGGLSPMKSAICVVAAFIAAFLTYRLIERPIRRAAPKPLVPAFLASSMVVLLATGALAATQLVLPRLKSFDVPAGNEWDFLEAVRSRLDDKTANFYPLHPERAEQVLFIGDSHLMQYAKHIDHVIGENSALPGAVFAVLPGCVPIEGWSRKERDMCWPMKEKAYAMAQESRFRTIVIGGAWDIYFSEDGQYYDDNGRWVSLTSDEGHRLALEHLQARITQLVEAGKDVVLVLDNPFSQSFNPTGPKLRLSLSTTGFEANGATTIAPQLHILHQKLAQWAKRSGARSIDPTKAVCEGDVCLVTTKTGQPLYRNRDHFNPDWAMTQATFIDAALDME